MKVNTIYRGDCKDVLSEAYTTVDDYFAKKGYGLPKQFADLIYLDPPFFSGRIYENFWPDDKEVRRFRDNWGYGLDDLRNNYIPYMRERIQRCKNVLKQDGSFYLHCDWHAGHYLKQMCDDIFGYKNFRNEIVWCYSGGGIPKKDYPRKHDTIFRYTKSNDYVFNVEYKEYSKGTIGIGSHSPLSGSKPLRESGTPLTDWWADIKPISGFIAKKERLGYPTQKPQSLLERIIKSSTLPGDIVLDPFCGCGTTLAAAQKLERQFIGIDISYKACKVVRERLNSIGVAAEIIDSVLTTKSLKELDCWAFQQYIIEIGHRGYCRATRGNDKGIDGFAYNDVPIQVKQCNVGRPFVDSFETALNRHYSGLGLQDKKKQGILVGYYFTDDAWKERQRAASEENIFIEFETLADILNNVNKRYETIEEMDTTFSGEDDNDSSD